MLEEGPNGDKLRFPLDIWYDRDAYIKHDPPNRAIRALCGPLTRRSNDWGGVVVVLRHCGRRRMDYRPVNDVDLYILAAYFASFCL